MGAVRAAVAEGSEASGAVLGDEQIVRKRLAIGKRIERVVFVKASDRCRREQYVVGK